MSRAQRETFRDGGLYLWDELDDAQDVPVSTKDVSNLLDAEALRRFPDSPCTNVREMLEAEVKEFSALFPYGLAVEVKSEPIREAARLDWEGVSMRKENKVKTVFPEAILGGFICHLQTKGWNLEPGVLVDGRIVEIEIDEEEENIMRLDRAQTSRRDPIGELWPYQRIRHAILAAIEKQRKVK